MVGAGFGHGRKHSAKQLRTGRLFALVTAFAAFTSLAAASSPVCLAGEVGPDRAKVVSVLDGDTVLLQTGHRLRYLGIDAPEVAHEGRPADCCGEEAKAANAALVLGKEIRIEYDGVQKDSHGRWTGYAFLMNGSCVNRELVCRGLAVLYPRPGRFRLQEDFLHCQKEAVDARRGMWGACPVKEQPFYWVNTASQVFHRPGCAFAPGRVSSRWKRFGSRWDCLKSGYSPCRRCKP